MDLSHITVAVLAGGMGTRLRSRVSDRPKVLAEVAGRPFLAYLLDQLAAAGCRDAVLCTGHLGEQVEAAFGTSYRELRLTYSREPAPLGTGGALRLAAPLLRSDPILLMNGDSFCQADLRAFADFRQQMQARAAVLLVHVPDSGRFGQVSVAADGRVLRFDEKQAGAGPGLINAGVYLISQALLQTLPPNGNVSLERDVFPHWVGQGFFGWPADGAFIDIGTPESLQVAQALLAAL